MTTLFHYPKCSTCRKARRWLDERGVDYELRDLVEDTPSASKLAELHQVSGLPIRKFFNTSGGSYREGGFKDKLPTMTEKQALEALSNDGMLIKRPLLEAGTHVVVGFKPEAYEALFGDDG